jgi:ribose 1,5-bisphosphokinase
MAGAEDHGTCDERAFDAAERRGEVALSWRAHGLRYGIPSAELASLRDGGVVVANISRRVITSAEAVAPRTVVLNITAPPGLLAARLAARGRETADDIAARLAREVPLETRRAELVTILNDRSVAEGAAEVVAVLRRLAGAR